MFKSFKLSGTREDLIPWRQNHSVRHCDITAWDSLAPGDKPTRLLWHPGVKSLLKVVKPVNWLSRFWQRCVKTIRNQSNDVVEHLQSLYISVVVVVVVLLVAMFSMLPLRSSLLHIKVVCWSLCIFVTSTLKEEKHYSLWYLWLFLTHFSKAWVRVCSTNI